MPEERLPGEQAEVFARRLAQEKACAVACGAGEVILGADTVVVLGEEVFGKPCDASHAREMIAALSGREHWVYTGICLRSEQHQIVDLAATKVTFSELAEDEIEEYVRSGEPMDKAGGYAIQGLASKFIVAIDGSYSNVVGLPVALVYRHLLTFGNGVTRS